MRTSEWVAVQRRPGECTLYVVIVNDSFEFEVTLVTKFVYAQVSVRSYDAELMCFKSIFVCFNCFCHFLHTRIYGFFRVSVVSEQCAYQD